jgi:nucleotide-binding universal stress UspA family protein
MFRKIVWATDGSELASRALPFVTDLARPGATEVIVLHVNPLLVGRAGGYSVLLDEDDVRAGLAAEVERLREQGYRARLDVITTSGSIPDAIADVARHARAELIVVGTHGYGFVRSTLMGSVTKRLLHLSPCAVLAVPVTHLPECAAEQAEPAGEPAEEAEPAR